MTVFKSTVLTGIFGKSGYNPYNASPARTASAPHAAHPYAIIPAEFRTWSINPSVFTADITFSHFSNCFFVSISFSALAKCVKIPFKSIKSAA